MGSRSNTRKKICTGEEDGFSHKKRILSTRRQFEGLLSPLACFHFGPGYPQSLQVKPKAKATEATRHSHSEPRFNVLTARGDRHLSKLSGARLRAPSRLRGKEKDGVWTVSPPSQEQVGGSERDSTPVTTENRAGNPRIPPSDSTHSPKVPPHPTASPDRFQHRAQRGTVDAPAHRGTSAPSPAQPGAAGSLSRHFRARVRSGGPSACAALGSSQLQPLVLTLLLRFPTPSPPRPGINVWSRQGSRVCLVLPGRRWCSRL